MNYLKRIELLNCVPNVMWKKNLTKEEILYMLNKYEYILNTHLFEKDIDFIMDPRRISMVERIKKLTHEDEKQALWGIDNMIWSFWEFISEDYHGPLFQEAQKRGISVRDTETIWYKYKKKGVICLEEKEIILNMINNIITYIINTK